jgi:glycosyltransferase involved in cell wall biosynthesis
MSLSRNNYSIAFTICAKNRLPAAILCRNSFLKHNKDSDFVIFLADQSTNKCDIKLFQSAMPMIAVNELKSLPGLFNSNKLEEMAYKYDVTEFCTSVKPFCIEYLMQIGYEKVLYFDPDIYFYNSVEPLFNWLLEYDCVLIPHITNPLPNDGFIPTDKDILSCGVYNLGFGGWANTEKTKEFLSWWQLHLKNECFHDTKNGMFVDQLWMNYAPCFLHTYVCKWPGYNRAYWNLHEGSLDEVPLAFYHFSGLEYTNPFRLSRHQNRYNLQELPVLRKMVVNYLLELEKFDAVQVDKSKYFYSADDRRVSVHTAFQKANPWLSKGWGLNLVGYFPYTIGVADVARHFNSKLASTGVPSSLHTIAVSKPTLSLDEQKALGYQYTTVADYDTSIFFVNLDQISKVHEHYPHLFKNRNIGVCWWEVEDSLPHKENAQHLDEIICFSEFTYFLFKKHLPNKKIHRLPYPVPAYNTKLADKSYCKTKLGLEPNDFVFYTVFDYASSFERKNPGGVIQAFSGIAKHWPNAKLVLKSLSAGQYPHEEIYLDALCKDLSIDNQVLVIDGPLSQDDLNNLMNMADCYVSLHRSEGAGLNILHALSLGKPVIATAYGGSMEFTNDNNSMLVNYEMVPIKQSIFGYEGKWANPDLNTADTHMEAILTNEELRQKLSVQARQSVLDYGNMQSFQSALYKVLLDE